MNPIGEWGGAGRFVGLATLISCALACTSAHMAVPGDVGSATETVLVDGRSQSSLFGSEDFKIGPYAVANVARGGKLTPRFRAAAGFANNEGRGYSFDLKRGEQSLHGECAAAEGESSTAAGGSPMASDTRKLACTCGSEGGPVVAGVVMQGTTLSHYGGALKAHDSTYDISALYDRQGEASDGSPSGYRVDGEGVQGAVDVLGPGRVWLAKTLEGDRRTDVICVFAGLLLYKK